MLRTKATLHTAVLDSLVRDVGSGLFVDLATRIIANGAKDVAQRNSRVATGNMRDNWQVVKRGDGFYLINETPYAVYNEYGTRYMTGQPMLAPAIMYIRTSIVAQFAAALHSLMR